MVVPGMWSLDHCGINCQNIPCAGVCIYSCQQLATYSLHPITSETLLHEAMSFALPSALCSASDKVL
eukprot:3288003-Amphidinium_carterae.1